MCDPQIWQTIGQYIVMPICGLGAALGFFWMVVRAV
jgi:hypothetical protein